MTGIQTAALCFGWYASSGALAVNEEYDGTSWTEQNDLNTARSQLAGLGTSTAALAAGGQTTPSGKNEVEEYNGTSWSEQNNLSVARYGFASAGLQTAGMVFGGVQNRKQNIEMHYLSVSEQ